MNADSKGSKSQSFEHMRMKLYFYENIPLTNEVTRIEEEYKIEDQIVDVYAELRNGKKVAIEIQHSKISYTTLIERTSKYTKRGIYVLWILNGNSFNKIPQNQDGIRLSNLELHLHKMYNGRVYYVNLDSKGLLSAVYALSYAPYFNLKDVVYKKKARSKRSVYCQQIESLGLKCTSKKYKLAMFRDTDVKFQCETEIYNILKKYCRETSRLKSNEKQNFLIIPVIKVISLLREKYGFYLVYDVLKTSRNNTNKLKIIRFGFMKDRENKVRECIKLSLADYINTEEY